MLNFTQLNIVIFVILCSKRNQTSSKAGGDPEEIINGEELPRGLYPFLVELRRYERPLQSPPGGLYGNGRDFEHFCGGTLIGRQTVLTAARKIYC